MEVAEFMVKGSAAEPYVVRFTWDGESLTGRCSCPGSRMGGKQCKHQTSILYACLDDIVSDNHGDVARVCGWMAGSSLEIALSRRDVAEAALKEAKAKLKSAQAEEKAARDVFEIAVAALRVSFNR